MYQPDPDIKFGQEDIYNFMEYLSAVQGGDGDGVYLVTDGMLEKNPFCPTAIYTDIEGEFLYHTRKATHGYVCEYNTQPFEGKRYVVCHNGILDGLKRYARLCGVAIGKNHKDVSDSYMMHKIIEKVGILNFYITFMSERYGVILCYDKVTKNMYLLKDSREFEYAKISGSYVYASSDLDYWILDEQPKSFGKGLYILKKDNIIKIHAHKDNKMEAPDYFGRSYYGSYYSTQYGKKITKSSKKTKGKNKD